jgi:hypothetical protein
MKKYMVVGFTDLQTLNLDDEPTQTERQSIFDEWMKWKDEMGVLLVDMGSPLLHGKSINNDGINGEAISNLAGYMIIKAENEKHAHELLRKSPLFKAGHGQKYELFQCLL